MRKNRFYIGATIIVAIVIVAFIVVCAVSVRNHNTAVAELREKAFPVAQQTPTPEPSVIHPSETNPPEMPIPESGKVTEEQGDTIAVFEALRLKMEEYYGPQWERAEDIIWGKKWSEWTEEDWDFISKYLKANQEIILEIRQLADSDNPFYELDYAKGYVNNYEVQAPNLRNFPHALIFRNFARWLNLDASVAAARGDYGTAVEDFIAIMSLANRLQEEPVAMSQLTSIAMVGMFYANINKKVYGENLSAEMLRNFIEAAYDTGDRSIFANAMATEGVFNLDKFDGVRHRNLNGTGIEPQGTEAYLMYFYGSTFARPFLNLDEDVYAETMNQMSDAMSLPFYEAKPILDRINTEIESLPRSRVLSRMLLPSFPRVADAQARHEATLGLMQVGLSIEHYHGQHGTYPETLEEIAPILNGPIPIDPYTGQPFVYEPRQNDFTLYSARGSVFGPGRPAPPLYNEQGNIVWRYTGE